jgi:hypothetical protein
MGREEVVIILYKGFFLKISLKVIEAKKIVLNYKPIHLPYKIEKKKIRLPPQKM